MSHPRAAVIASTHTDGPRDTALAQTAHGHADTHAQAAAQDRVHARRHRTRTERRKQCVPRAALKRVAILGRIRVATQLNVFGIGECAMWPPRVIISKANSKALTLHDVIRQPGCGGIPTTSADRPAIRLDHGEARAARAQNEALPFRVIDLVSLTTQARSMV